VFEGSLRGIGVFQVIQMDPLAADPEELVISVVYLMQEYGIRQINQDIIESLCGKLALRL
jgi:hypothetical protein